MSREACNMAARAGSGMGSMADGKVEETPRGTLIAHHSACAAPEPDFVFLPRLFRHYGFGWPIYPGRLCGPLETDLLA